MSLFFIKEHTCPLPPPNFPKGYDGDVGVFYPPFNFKKETYLVFNLISKEGMDSFLSWKASLREEGYRTEDFVRYGIEEGHVSFTSSGRKTKETSRFTDTFFVKGTGCIKNKKGDHTVMKE